jgi:hypothetical protein
MDQEEVARPTRFERVTFAFGGQTPTNPAVHRRRKLKGWTSTWMSHMDSMKRLEAKRRFSPVAQMVGFGLRKMLYLSMGVD